MKQRIYIITETKTGWKHYVRANTRQQALAYVARLTFEQPRPATADDIARAAHDGKLVIDDACAEKDGS